MINCTGLFIRLKDLVELGRSKYLDYYCESEITFLTMVHRVRQEKKIFVRSNMGRQVHEGTGVIMQV